MTDPEWRLMNVAWAQSPVTARDVLEGVEGETGWAYSTVKTMLARLVEKGALTVRMRANTGLYTPVVSRDQARRSALRSLLDNAFEGAFGSLVHHMVSAERLNAKERRRLRSMLEELDRAQAGGSKA